MCETMYFARVTDHPELDLERATSVHLTDEVEGTRKLEENEVIVYNQIAQIINGICGYEMDASDLASIEELEKELEEFKNSKHIPFGSSDPWHVFKGIYGDISNCDDGTVFIPCEIVI